MIYFTETLNNENFTARVIPSSVARFCKVQKNLTYIGKEAALSKSTLSLCDNSTMFVNQSERSIQVRFTYRTNDLLTDIDESTTEFTEL